MQSLSFLRKVLDAASGRVLWEKNAEIRSLIASTTKILTGLLIAEDCCLDDLVVISEEAADIEGSSLYLQAGSQYSVKELLYGMLLRSGNDAAAALAIHHSGSIESFAEAMNNKAQELGMRNSHFENPHGLDSEQHYSTALDLAKLSASAMENPVFYHAASSKTAEFEDRTYSNHNKLLWQLPGTVGIKTGYTKSAGRVLVSCVERDGRRLIGVTISAPDDWNDHRLMMEYGFYTYAQTPVAEAGKRYATVPLIGGAGSSVSCSVSETVFWPVRVGETVRVESDLPDFVYAPVFAGEMAGNLIIYLNEREIHRVPLFWCETVLEGL